ncbi:UDP-N-acetylmuramoylalanine--D-glutamate ligase [Candidatus Pelagibacter sp. HTCC7211]|uniref:UDP-N-acetylmuramoyl-L-alanine--D-glutamate ligase n=1 Tax=Pelagibacter sp. (strain HTCC7211) TaxID=439493 RepID=UPI0001838D14|nr:UDP-N-acetylmuramoyl-L-alanine--D-glutamate ligase [Candidatus Pelagibacter sp. HTCC7211]EDZ61008.1 UDP-N-acetylmuramoylalanine--D-glutamate ligase [Candidatus Pelagibacter sp. HTCC7211]
MKKLSNIFLGKKILVYGLGKSGISTYKFLKKSSDVYLFDDNHRINFKYNQKIISLKKIKKINFDRIIISPGIDISNCKLSKFLNNNLLKIHTDLDVLFSFYDNKSITITGTNGKSTTAKILHDALTDQKRDSRLIGNIGNPVLAEKNITKKTIFVIEASSYQLDYSRIFRSKYAVILNITSDHIERHKSLNNYVDAKFKLLKSQNRGSFAYIKKDDELITKKIKKNKYKAKIYKVQTSNLNKKFDKIYNKYFISDGNKENLLFIFEIASKLKLNKKKLIRSINRFKGLDYRQQIIFDKKNLTIINDSKSTSFASSESVLKNLNGAYWILGGIPKKGDKFKLSKTKCKNLKAFIFGSHSKKFLEILKNKLKVKSFKNMEETLKVIFSEITIQKSEKNIIFFSPAGASFDSFRNFEDRGNYFNQLVKKYINAK